MTSPRARSALRPRWIQISLLGLVAIASLFLLIYLSSSVSQKLRELGSARADNVQWTMSQIEVEFLDFQAAVAQAQTRTSSLQGQPQPELKSALANLRKRYNIFYSRLETIAGSALYRPILDYANLRGRFEDIAQVTYGLVPTIDANDTTLVQALPDVAKAIAPLRQDLRLISTEGNRQLALQADRAREDAARVLRLVALVSLLLAAAVIWLLFVFWRLYRLNRSRAITNRAILTRIETIISTSRDAIIVCDPTGRISDFNSAAETLFGRPRAQAETLDLGVFLRKPLESYTGDSAARHEQISRRIDTAELLESCVGGASRSEQLLGRDAQGRHFAIELTVDRAEHDGRTILVCFVRNISHRLAAEQELVRSRDKALAGERAKARFLAVMSHEMRTPLNGILGTIDLLDSAELTAPQRELVDVLRNSGQVLLSHINEVLDITRIESGQLPLERAPFDLDVLLGEVVQSLRPVAAANGNSITLNANSLGLVSGTRGRLRQVLVNLLSNAAKFTKDGEIAIEAARTGADQIEFQISDTGSGIPTEALAQVFEDFVRLGEGGADDIEGTGLGLGITRNLVTAMGGEIGAESEFGEGSLFWVRLPLPAAEMDAPANPRAAALPDQTGAATRSAKADDAAAPISAPATKPKAAPPARSGSKPLDVLIVEDNKTNRFIAREMLRRDGHRVTEAHDGVDGVDAAAAKAYDLILMDISMPRMDGVEATKAIRASGGASKDSRIIALTAHAQPEDHARYLAAGMEAVLNKPLRWAVLREMLYHEGAQYPEHGAPDLGQETPYLDRQALGEMRRALPQPTFIRLAQEFIAEGDAFIGALDRLIDLPPAQARAALHGFAGSCATFGARAMHEALGRCETVANTGADWNQRADKSLAPLPALWSSLRAALHAELEAAQHRDNATQEASPKAQNAS
ncbi:response regulator [Litorivita sp. NS0012-18]|uniref:hybrid sensor histidine kinase/response regulator n=1 Tax=Litorivita sp. NS0012-18 TaxID=3127655 RepID=UPI00310388DF